MPIDVDAIEANGWRQGCLFDVESSQALLGPRSTSAGSRLILASQDCDIVHRGPREPFVDTFEAVPIAGLSSTEQKARNPRLLHLPIEVRGAAVAHEVYVWSRLAIERENLARRRPDQAARLSEATLRWFRQWLGRRYTRIGFPGEFNRRIDGERRQGTRRLREILEPCEDCFEELLIAISPADVELPREIAYEIQVVLLMREAVARDPAKYERVRGAADKFRAFLAARPGIVVQAVEPMADTQFNYAELRSFFHWDFADDLSLDDSA